MIFLIYKFLRESGINVAVIQNRRFDLENRIDPVNLEKTMGTQLQTIKFKRPRVFKFAYQDFPSLELFSSDKSTISMVFVRRIPPRCVLKKLRNSDSKIIFCLHGIAVEKFRMTSFLIMSHQIIMRIQLRNLAHFLGNNIFAQCLTPHTVLFLRKAGGPDENIFKIENEFESDVDEIIPNNDEFKVLFIGRMQNLTKGIKFLKRVIKKVKKIEPYIEFVVIGSGPDLHILGGLSDHVKLLSNASDEVKADNLLHSNLAIITSKLEPFPRVAMEFLGSGLPVVTTPSSGPSYIISKDKVFGRVSSFNAKSFSTEILSYYNEWKKDKAAYFEKRKEIALRNIEILVSNNP